MIRLRYTVKAMLKDVEVKTGRKVNISTLAEESGVNRNTLSRLTTQPERYPSTLHIERLLNWYLSQTGSSEPTLDRTSHAFAMLVDFWTEEEYQNFKSLQGKLKQMKRELDGSL